MKTNKNITLKRNLKGFTLVELLVVIAIIASLAGLSYGPIMRHLDSSARTEAISNGKNIFTGLTGYMAANEGNYPTDEKVTAATLAPATAAGHFTLLMRNGHIGEDKYFYHKAGEKVGLATAVNNNDAVVDTAENVWGYVEGLTASDTAAPLIFDSSDDAATFLTHCWKGKAIIIKADGAAKAYDILGGYDSTTANTTSAIVNITIGGADTDIMGATSLAGGVAKAPN